MSGTSRIKIAVLSAGLIVIICAVAFKHVAAEGVTTPAALPATKVAIVDIQQAIATTNEGHKDLEAIRERFAPREAALNKQNEELNALKQQLQNNTLSEQDREIRLRNIEVKQKQLQRDFEDAQSEAQTAQQEVANRVAGKMVTVLDKYAKANGITVVLDVSSPQTQVLWANPAINITKELVNVYNAEAPAGVAPAPKSAAPAPKSTAPAAKPSAPAPKTTPK